MIHRINRRDLLALTAWACLPGHVAFGSDAQSTILTIGGLPGGAELRLDRIGIEARGLTSLDVETPWYTGVRHYEGISLKRLLSEAGVKSAHEVHLHALNDYAVDMPMDVIDRYDPLLAIKRDGAYMPVRGKGPLFLLFPFGAHEEIRVPWFYSRCIWQVDAITVSI